MCNDSDDILITYNSNCLDQYIDSSDFDEPKDNKGENHKIIRRKVFKKKIMEESLKEKMFYAKSLDKKYVSQNHQCTCKNSATGSDGLCSYQNSYNRRKIKYSNDERSANNHTLRSTSSRLSMVKHKVMPCLSNIFCRSNNKHTESGKAENVIDFTKDTGCQVYSVQCTHRQTRKFNKRGQYYTVQSMYSTDDESNKIPVLLEPRQRESNMNCNFSSSSLNIQGAKNKFKKVIERELMKYNLKKHYIKRNREQQYPSKPNFHVFTSTESSDKNDKTCFPDVNSFGCSAMPSNSSVFWEYLVDRIHKKYQNNGIDNKNRSLKSCHCVSSQQCPSMAAGFQKSGSQSPKAYETQEQAVQNSVVITCMCKSSAIDKPMNFSNQKIHTPKQNAVSKVQCKCHPTMPPNPKSTPPSSQHKSCIQAPDPPTTTPSDTANRPCQEPHDEIKASLQQKYNGEILCIHNPPCILINGCLNLPPVKGQFSPTAWPVTGETSFHARTNKSMNNNKFEEQACQYQPQSLEYLQYQMLEEKIEKMTQSICNHVPPCEIVRGCYKPNFDPQLENSCVHVPMCLKIPKCVLRDSKDGLKECEHQPKCPEIPVCKEKPKKYAVMMAKDNVGTQAKAAPSLECRHEPPCIMIPRCLGRLMCDGYVPYDAIPDCTHQPTCDMIPACCRKSAKMVSVYCQYPAPCRIV